jgi:hypothetical protein
MFHSFFRMGNHIFLQIFQAKRGCTLCMNQHVKHLDSLRMWLQKENTEIIHSVRDRKKYRESMIAMSKTQTFFKSLLLLALQTIYDHYTKDMF